MKTTRPGTRGFTLLESMIAVAVAAIVSTLAVPSIESQLQRMRRGDGLVAVLAVQLAQERWRANAPSFATLGELGLPSVSVQRHYTLAVADAGPDGYALTATATGAQARDRACRVLRLVVDGGTTQFASERADGTVNDDAANRRCWNR
jgi:type IV pilus assembly protein PilE